MLTALRPDDLESIIQLYTSVKVRRFLGGPVAEGAVRTQFLKSLETGTFTRQWVIRLRENCLFVGIISLGLHHNGVDMEVSYQLLPEWWGLGYASETVQAVITHCWDCLELSRVVAETQTRNVASCRLLERLGMRLEAKVERFGAEQAIYVIER